jgi:hypothetical protein
VLLRRSRHPHLRSRRLRAQGKTDVQDARRPVDDERLPAAVRRRKGRADLEEEHRVRTHTRGRPSVASAERARMRPAVPQRLKEAMDINMYENKPVPRSRS